MPSQQGGYGHTGQQASQQAYSTPAASSQQAQGSYAGESPGASACHLSRDQSAAADVPQAYLLLGQY